MNKVRRSSHFLIKNSTCLLMSTMLFTSNLLAEEQPPIQLYSYILKHRLDEQGTKPYNKVLSYVLQDMEKDIHVRPLPLRRAAYHFQKDYRSCIFPTAASALKKVYKKTLGHRDLKSSLPVDRVSLRFFTRANQPVIRTDSQLKGKRIGLLLGSVGSDYILKNKGKVISVADESRLVKLLSMGRIDALLGHNPDTPIAMERLGMSHMHAAQGLDVYNTDTYIVCHDFPGVKNVLAKINLRLEQLHKNGVLKSILGPYSEIASYPEP